MELLLTDFLYEVRFAVEWGRVTAAFSVAFFPSWPVGFFAIITLPEWSLDTWSVGGTAIFVFKATSSEDCLPATDYEYRALYIDDVPPYLLRIYDPK